MLYIYFIQPTCCYKSNVQYLTLKYKFTKKWNCRINYFPILSTLIISSAMLLGDVSMSYMLFDSLFPEKVSLNMSVDKLCWLKLFPGFESVIVLLLSVADNTLLEWDSFDWSVC